MIIITPIEQNTSFGIMFKIANSIFQKFHNSNYPAVKYPELILSFDNEIN